MSNVREMLATLTSGLEAVSESNPEVVGKFMALVEAGEAPGSLDTKTKELISIGVAVYARCEHCIVYHVRNAYEAGASRKEIMEAGLVAIVFGGGPSITYLATFLKDAVDAFEHDFDK